MIWQSCEIDLPKSDIRSLPGMCPQSILSIPTIGGVIFRQSLSKTKDALAWVVASASLAYAVLVSFWWAERDREKARRMTI